MPVTDTPIESQPDPRVERLLSRTRTAVGASDRMPVRVLAYFVLIGACMTLAPIPANIIGVAAVALLALDTAIHRR